MSGKKSLINEKKVFWRGVLMAWWVRILTLHFRLFVGINPTRTMPKPLATGHKIHFVEIVGLFRSNNI